MAIKAVRVTVTTSATVVSQTESEVHRGRLAGRDFGSSCLVTNTGSVTLFLGGSDVLSTTGYALAVGASVGIDLISELDVLYAVTASGSGQASVLQAGV